MQIHLSFDISEKLINKKSFFSFSLFTVRVFFLNRQFEFESERERERKREREREREREK